MSTHSNDKPGQLPGRTISLMRAAHELGQEVDELLAEALRRGRFKLHATGRVEHRNPEEEPAGVVTLTLRRENVHALHTTVANNAPSAPVYVRIPAGALISHDDTESAFPVDGFESWATVYLADVFLYRDEFDPLLAEVSPPAAAPFSVDNIPSYFHPRLQISIMLGVELQGAHEHHKVLERRTRELWARFFPDRKPLTDSVMRNIFATVSPGTSKHRDDDDDDHGAD